MSIDPLHQIANDDTPSAVNVPRTISGLIIWAVGRFGSGIVMALACAWALSKVYEDHAKQTDRMMTILEMQGKRDSEIASAMNGVKNAVDEIAKEARMAHKGGQ